MNTDATKSEEICPPGEKDLQGESTGQKQREERLPGLNERRLIEEELRRLNVELSQQAAHLRQVNQTLLDSEQRLRLAIETGRIGLWVWNNSEVDPIQREIAPLKALKKVVMVEPNDSHVYEGERICEIRGPFVREIFRQSTCAALGRCISRTRRVMMIANAPSLNISNRDVSQSSGSLAFFAERTEISDMDLLFNAEVATTF